MERSRLLLGILFALGGLLALALGFALLLR